MSEFDTCRVICPSCESFVEIQSKAGRASYKTYPMEKTPLAVLDDIQEESKRGRVECFSCGCALAVVVSHSVKVRPLSDQLDYDKDWGEDDE